MVSVVCPVLNEEKYITTCLESLLSQDILNEVELEILFVDGGSLDNTKNIISSYVSRFPFVRLLNNPYKTAPFAMNIGIKNALGDIVVRVDAHCFYPSNYISVLVDALNRIDNAENVGTPIRTMPGNNTMKAVSIAEVLQNRWGVGGSLFRLGVNECKKVDTVPFGCWRKDLFDRIGLFDERLTRNQDLELNKRIISHGGEVWLVPDAYVIYFARNNYRSFSLNNFQNGFWGMYTVRLTHNLRSLSFRHYVPMLFVLSILFLSFCSCFSHIAFVLFESIVILYLILIGCISLRLSICKRIFIGFLMLSFVLLHIPYGFGSLWGCLKKK